MQKFKKNLQLALKDHGVNAPLSDIHIVVSKDKQYMVKIGGFRFYQLKKESGRIVEPVQYVPNTASAMYDKIADLDWTVKVPKMTRAGGGAPRPLLDPDGNPVEVQKYVVLPSGYDKEIETGIGPRGRRPAKVPRQKSPEAAKRKRGPGILSRAFKAAKATLAPSVSE